MIEYTPARISQTYWRIVLKTKKLIKQAKALENSANPLPFK